MNDVIKMGKKAFTWSVVMMTIVWSMGLAALMPLPAQAASCPTLTAGTLVKAKGASAVYLVTSDLKRLYFPHDKVYKTWYADYSGVQEVPMVDDSGNACLEPYDLTGGVNPRPGSYLVKSTDSPSVYVVLPENKKAKLGDATVAAALYGSTWGTKVYDYAPSFMANLSTATDSTISTQSLHNGQLVKKEGTDTVYYVADSKLYSVDGTLPTYLSNDVKTVSATVFASREMAGTSKTVATVTSDPGQNGGTSLPQGGTVTVSLAADTPAASYIAKGAYNAEFTKLTFKNTSTGSVRVDKIVVKRDGLGVDADITAVRLYDGATQLGSDQALNTNTHLATFNNINWDIAAGATKTLIVKADTYSSASGTNDYMAVTVVELEGTGTVSASLPVNGNAMQYHAVTMGTLDVDALSTPGASNLISGATDQQVACFNFDTDANEGFSVKSVRITNAGTAANEDITKFVLKDGATVIGTANSTFGSDGTVTIDMNASPYFIDKSKSKDLCVYVDIKSGIKDSLAKTIILQIAESKDVVAVGDSSKAQVVVTKTDGTTTFTAQSSQTMTIAQGGLTITRNTATLPVSTALIDGVAHNKLTAYKFTAGSTEGVKVTRLRLTVSGADLASTDWSNFELYKYDETTATETQVGSSQSMSGNYVTFEDTSNGLFDVAKSKNVIIHVYADVNTSAAWTGTVGNVFIGTTNSDLIVKAKGLDSGEYINPSDISLSSVDSAHANVTLFSNSDYGTLTVSLANDSPEATSIAAGSYDKDLLHVKLYATGEDMSVTALTLRAYEDSGTTAADTIETADNAFSNVRLYDVSGTSPVLLGSAVASPATGVATYSFTLTVPKDSYKILKAVADIPSDASNSYIKLVAASTTSDITTTGSKSGQDITESGSATGKTMTMAAPSLAVSWASGVTNNLVANATNETLGTLQLTAGAYEDVRVTSIKVYFDDATPIAADSSADSSFSNVKLIGTDSAQFGITKNITGATIDYVLFDGISNLTVSKGTTKIIYIKADVTGTSGTYYVGTTATSDVVGSGIVSGTSASVSGTGTGRANTINTTALLTFAVDASNPNTKLVSVGANSTGVETTMLTLAADAQYEDINITKLVISDVSGSSSDLVQQAFNDNGIKLYHKVGSGTETLVASASLVSSTAAGLATYYTATFNISLGDLKIGKSSDDLLIVKGVFKGIDEGLTSAVSPLFRLGNNTAADDSLFVEARGVSSGTSLDDSQFNSTSALYLSGNQMVAYKAYPTITYQNPGSTLVNGAENNIYSFKVAANGGTVALKQLQFNLDIVDNEGTYDAPTLSSFKLYRTIGNSTENITDNVFISKSTGVSITAGGSSMATGTSQSFYITWITTGEEQIPNGSEYLYTIKATSANFNTDADNDYIRVRMGNTDTSELSQANATYYLVPWGASTNHVNLLTLCGSAGTNVVATSTPISMIWSDRNAASHSAVTGTYGGGTASSSGDWFNGYYVKETPTDYSHLTR